MKNILCTLVFCILCNLSSFCFSASKDSNSNLTKHNKTAIPQVGKFNQTDLRDANPPNDVTVSVNAGIVTLSWTPVSGAAGYLVEASNSPVTGFSDVTSTGVFSNLSGTVTWSKTITVVYQFFRIRSISGNIPANFVLVEGSTINDGMRNITVSSFYMDKNELSQSDYQSVMGTNPSYFSTVSNGPVERVTWFNAIEYCNRRSVMEGLTPCYSFNNGTDYGTNPDNWPIGWNVDWIDEFIQPPMTYNQSLSVLCNWTANGYRLPTNMEWYYTALGGNLTHNYTYSGSNTLGDVAWYGANSNNTTHTEGTKTANELGIYDMSGNVREWCWDINVSYDPGTGLPSNNSHYTRGGDWSSTWEYLFPLSYFRYTSESGGASNNYTGFRICRFDPDVVAMPVLIPDGGTYATTQSVSISCVTSSAQIRYTTDGSEPTASSSLYSSPISITQSTILKAKAYKPGCLPSNPAATGFIIGTTPGQMIAVQGGTFYDGIQDITITSFMLDKYELTQTAFLSVVHKNINFRRGLGNSYPMYNINWLDAVEYCNRRSIGEGLTPCYSYNDYSSSISYGTNPDEWPLGWNTEFLALSLMPGGTWLNNARSVSCNWLANGYRLPTTSEWMYTALGGNLTHNYTYSGSNFINTIAWYNANSGSASHTIGTKTANELSLFDMSGNVNEWCWDLMDDPYMVGFDNGIFRPSRGGCWNSDESDCAIMSSDPYIPRYAVNAMYSSSYSGMRICRNELNTVETPIISPTGGNYSSAQTVSMSCPTSGAQIRYTTNGSDPTSSSTLYSTPVSVSTTTTLKAKAFKTGWTASGIATALYTITGTVATPTFNPVAGTYTTSQSVTISCSTSGAEIRYTTNGTDPTGSSTLYSTPITVSVTTTLKAKAFKTGWTSSGIATALYTITGTVATPTFNPVAGTYTTSQSVTISCSTSGAEIRYTTNGTDPTGSSTLYSTPVTVSTTTTLKAKAFKTDWISSGIATAVYTINSSSLILVSGGTFNNGTSNITVSSFYLDKYELTQSAYQAVMGSNPSNFTSVTNGPVERVSWFKAIEYCNRRSISEGFTPCYSYSTYGTNPTSWPTGWNTSDANHANVACNWTANGYRLPTEMEWMFAARGGNSTNNYTYSGSNTVDVVAWYTTNASSITHTVGIKTANELGIFDMSGNVWEWCWDSWGTYPSSAQTNPHGPASNSNRIFRGGGWYDNASSCTVSMRGFLNAIGIAGDVGFRVCRNAQ